MVKGAASSPKAGGATKQPKLEKEEDVVKREKDQEFPKKQGEAAEEDGKGDLGYLKDQSKSKKGVNQEGEGKPEGEQPVKEEKKVAAKPEREVKNEDKGKEEKGKEVKEEEKTPEEIIKKYEAQEQEHDAYYYAGFTDEEAEEEHKRHDAATKLKQEPQKDNKGKVTEEEKQRRAELEHIAHDLPENTLEEGHIFFFYRPKLGNLPAQSVHDVQRFYFILQPTVRKGATSEEKFKCRLIVVGKKKLPNVTHHERYFAFVAAIADTVEEINGGMGESGRMTKKGLHSQGAARLAGSGAYSLCTKTKAGGWGRRKRDVRLAYKLELPVEGEEGECQKELDMDRIGYFVISVKNPELKDESKAAGLPTAGPKPEYTEKQEHQLQGLRWSGPFEDVTVLDYKGTELLLIRGRNQQLQTSIGPAADHLEALAQKDIEQAQKETGKDKKEALTAQLQETIGPAPDITPSTDGHWK